MSESFHLKAGDTAPRIEAVLKSNNGDPVDLRVSTVSFRLLKPRGGDVLFENSANVVNGTEGIVQYQWDESDTENSGLYNAEFVVEYNDDTIESFPNDGYHDVIITD